MKGNFTYQCLALKLNIHDLINDGTLPSPNAARPNNRANSLNLTLVAFSAEEKIDSLSLAGNEANDMSEMINKTLGLLLLS